MAHRLAVTLEQCWHRVPGGTATSALRASAALDAHPGVEVVGVSAWHRHPPPEAFRPSIPVRPLRLSRLWLYESWHRLRRPPVQAATGPVDAVWVSGVAMPPRSAPLIVTVHDLAVLDHPEHHTSRGRSFLRRAVELARRDADLVLCPSQTTLDRCVEAGFESQRLRLVPWGVDLARADDEAVAAVRRHHGLVRPYVLWTGTVEPRKNLPRLLEAFARIDRDDVDLALVGPDGWNEDIDRAVEALGDRVHRLGFVSDHELTALYAGADLFVYPSLLEGFGLPVLEAMAQGTPVVTAAGTSTAELVGEIGVAVEPRSVDAIVGGMNEVLGDVEVAAEQGAALRRRAESFTWERTAQGIVDAVAEVVA